MAARSAVRSNASLCPVASIQITIPDGFGDMDGLYLLRAGEVGNGAGHLEDAAVGTGREFQALHGHAKHVERCLVGIRKVVEHLFRHLRVAVDAGPTPNPSRSGGEF